MCDRSRKIRSMYVNALYDLAVWERGETHAIQRDCSPLDRATGCSRNQGCLLRYPLFHREILALESDIQPGSPASATRPQEIDTIELASADSTSNLWASSSLVSNRLRLGKER